MCIGIGKVTFIMRLKIAVKTFDKLFLDQDWLKNRIFHMFHLVLQNKKINKQILFFFVFPRVLRPGFCFHSIDRAMKWTIFDCKKLAFSNRIEFTVFSIQF